jgi:purine catabolism regulator
MPLTLGGLIGDPSLQLHVEHWSRDGDPAVTGAHVSELLRPGQWLAGGEILMTIGVLLPTTPEDCAAYVRDVQDGGAVALAVGLGRGFPHRAVPAPLVDAAADVGLPLLSVPEEVPFISITSAVYSAIVLDERRALEGVVELHKALTFSAASGGGLEGIVSTWTATTGVGVVVTDPLGVQIAASDPVNGSHPNAEALRELAGVLAPKGVRGALKTTIDGNPIEVQPVGTTRLRAFVVLVGSTGPLIPVATTALISILALELERRWLTSEPDRQQRARAFQRVLVAESESDAEALLRAAGLTGTEFRCVVVDPGTGSATDLVADLSLTIRGGLIRRTEGGLVEAIVMSDADIEQDLRRFTPNSASGIGALTTPGTLASSRAQATAALITSRALGRPVTYRRGFTQDWLLNATDLEQAQTFSEAVIAPLTQADPSGALVATVEAWLTANCQIDPAAERLQVHRHTVRSRLRKVEQLIGQPLDQLDTRVELWLALTAKGVHRLPTARPTA